MSSLFTLVTHTYLILILLHVCLSANYKNDLKEKYPDYGETWMYIPNGDGDLEVANFTTSEEDNKSNSRSSNPESTIHFQFYSRSNPDQYSELVMKPEEGEPGYDPNDKESENGYPFNEKKFNISQPAKFLIHGWRSSGNSSTVINMKNAYVSDRNCNVIIVDWSHLASNNYYLKSAKNTKIVGRHTGKLINKLITKYNMSSDLIHVVGHSLGAHTAGYAGAYMNGSIARISGLDPALPGFEFFATPEDRLDETDARFVDVIHTCAGVLGYTTPLGDADFYPNGGTASQPGCGVEGELVEACSHARAHIYFTESIRRHKGFLTKNCVDMEEFQEKQCSGKQAIMGDGAFPDHTGIHYLRTNSKEPYSNNDSSD